VKQIIYRYRIARLMNFRRIWNLFILAISFQVQKWTKSGKTSVLPFSLSLEPTTACNLGCPECPSGLKKFTRPTGKMDLYFHKKLLQEVSKTVFYINYYFQGEPFLHPQFLELIREAKRHKIFTSTSTNAHFIDEKKAHEIVDSGLDQLIISIDGLTQETYESYRVAGQLSRVIEGAKLMVEAKKIAKSSAPHLVFQFLAVAPNEHEIPTVFNLAKEMEIDEVRIKTAQVYDYKNGNPLIPKNEEYSRYRQMSNGEYRIKNKLLNHCWRMWSSSVVTWDGKMVPCCFDKDAQHTLGEIGNQTFSDIWFSDIYNGFRKNVFTKREEIDICKNCTEGTKVWA
jgi:radical SAM protein with 4Fe4S-binding SPASM domain